MIAQNPLRAVAVMTFISALSPAIVGSAEPTGSVSDEDLLMARNPIIIKSRVRVANEFTDVGGGGHRDKIILSGGYGFGFNGRDKNFGIGIELPILYNEPENGSSDWGLGDFKLRLGQILREDPAGLRAGWFMDTEFDTSDDAVRAIANQRTQMAFGAGLSYPMLENLVLSTSLQYGWSLENGETSGRKSEWESHLTLSAKVTDRLSLNLDYKGVLNTVGGETLINTLEPGFGYTLGTEKNIGIFASCELPLDETGVNWVAKTGIIWFF